MLMFVILSSNFANFAYAKENKTYEEIMNQGKENSISLQHQKMGAIPVTGAVYDSMWEKIWQEKVQGNDQYNYSKKDIEQLIFDGTTIEDLYLSDYFGNEWGVDPKQLIELKKQSKQSWKEIEVIISELEKESLFNDDFSVTNSVYGTQNIEWNKFQNLKSDIDSILNGLITQQQINQTNKPQYADRNGTSERIDPASGKLTWKQTDIQLPGRDGLDLNIGVMYDSNNSFNYTRHYGSPGQIKKFNYLISRYDLGMGWSFQFPSIQLVDGYLYYHRGDGAIYRIDFDTEDALGKLYSLSRLSGERCKINTGSRR